MSRIQQGSHYLVLAIAAFAATAFAQHTNIDVGPNETGASEATIALDPTNPLNLIAGANIYHVYHSTDGGFHWSADTLRSRYGVWGDPCLLFDESGLAYYAHLSFPDRVLPADSDNHWIDRIVVARSSTGGSSWEQDTFVGFRGPRAQQDKQWLVCDASRSPRRGAMYMSWTEFDVYAGWDSTYAIAGDSSRILFSRSTDHGASWSEPITISDIDGDCYDGDATPEGAVPAVDINGNVHVLWADRRGLVIDQSTDGGMTFGEDRVLRPLARGWDFSVTGLQRCNGLPVLLSDLGNSRHRGNLYAMYSEQVEGSGSVNIYVLHSEDNGISWSDPVRVTGDTTNRPRFFPAISVDNTTGNIYIVYYDRRARGGDTTEVWLSRSSDGGVTYSDMRIDDSAFVPTTGFFLGDYIGIAAGNGTAYPIWTRGNRQENSIVTAVIRDSQGVMAVEHRQVLPRLVSLAQNYPNPFGDREGSTTIMFTLERESAVNLTVHSLDGRTVRTLVNGRMRAGLHYVSVRGEDLNTGSYLYRLRAGGTVIEKLMTVVR